MQLWADNGLGTLPRAPCQGLGLQHRAAITPLTRTCDCPSSSDVYLNAFNVSPDTAWIWGTIIYMLAMYIIVGYLSSVVLAKVRLPNALALPKPPHAS